MSILKSPKIAVDLFLEKGAGYVGRRLFLTKIGEETDEGLVKQICRRCDYSMYGSQLTKHVVFFKVDQVLPLVGSGS